MEPPGATAKWPQGPNSAALPITELESVAPRLDKTSLVNYQDCTWPSERTRSQMVAAWRSNMDLVRNRQMQEPPVGGVSRSVLHRLLASPDSAPSTPLHSPRRRCSAASAAMVAMVHSPRAFASSDCLKVEKGHLLAQTVPYQCLSPMVTGCGSFDSSSNCNSRCIGHNALGMFSDGPIPSDDEEDMENEDHVSMLRQQVTLLVKSLEGEKKRRASEQQLMQSKIIELQTLIRRNGNEVASDNVDAVTKASSTQDDEWLDNVQVRRWSAPVEETEGMMRDAFGSIDLNGEKDAKEQLAQIRAQMHAIVIDAQRETQALRAQLEGAKRSHVMKEKQLTVESTVKVAALEQKHAIATTRHAQQAADYVVLVEKLQSENRELVTQIQAQEKRVEQLELALDSKQIVDTSR